MSGWIAALCALVLAGCGYRPVALPESAGEQIAIRMLENRSAEPGFERLFVDALHEEFARRGSLRPHPAGAGDASGLVLSGVVREISVRPTGFSSVALPLEDQVVIVMDVAVQFGGEGEIVWRRDGFRAEERFTSSADPNVYESNKNRALRRLASELAGQLHDELLQSF